MVAEYGLLGAYGVCSLKGGSFGSNDPKAWGGSAAGWIAFDVGLLGNYAGRFGARVLGGRLGRALAVGGWGSVAVTGAASLYDLLPPLAMLMRTFRCPTR